LAHDLRPLLRAGLWPPAQATTHPMNSEPCPQAVNHSRERNMHTASCTEYEHRVLN
jgi:hypothetical protein